MDVHPESSLPVGCCGFWTCASGSRRISLLGEWEVGPEVALETTRHRPSIHPQVTSVDLWGCIALDPSPTPARSMFP